VAATPSARNHPSQKYQKVRNLLSYISVSRTHSLAKSTDDWYCEFCAGAFLTPLSMRSLSPTTNERHTESNDVDSAISIEEYKQENGIPIDQPLSSKRVCKKRTFLGDEDDQVPPLARKKKPQTMLKARINVSHKTESSVHNVASEEVLSSTSDTLKLTDEERTAKQKETQEYFATFGHKLMTVEADTQRGRPQETDRRDFFKCRTSEVDNALLLHVSKTQDN
jgi:hypothetical protein